MPVMTIGTVRVRFCTALTARMVETTTALGCPASSSAASAGKRLESLLAQRVSNT